MNAIVCAPAVLSCMTNVVVAFGARSHIASVQGRIIPLNAYVDPRPIAVAVVANAIS